MTRGRQPKVNDEINWVTDEDGNVLGYMKDDKTLIPITELTDAQRANPAIVGAAGVGNGKIYDENSQEIVASSRIIRMVSQAMNTSTESTFNGGTLGFSRTHRTRHYLNMSFYAFRIPVAFFYTDSNNMEVLLPEAYRWQVGFEQNYLMANANIPDRPLVTFGGLDVVTFDPANPPAKGYVWSDWIYLDKEVPAGQYFGFWTTIESVTPGDNKIPYYRNASSFAEQRYIGTVSASNVSQINARTAATAKSVSLANAAQSGGSNYYAPPCMQVMSRDTHIKTVVLSGSSIQNGIGEGNVNGSGSYGDSLGSPKGNRGYMERGVMEESGAQIALQMSKGSRRLGQYVDVDTYWKYSYNLLRESNADIIELGAGRNDVAGTVTVPSRSASTPYSLYDNVRANGNNSYMCISPGSSGAATSLSDTGGSVLDGSVVWKWLLGATVGTGTQAPSVLIDLARVIQHVKSAVPGIVIRYNHVTLGVSSSDLFASDSGQTLSLGFDIGGKRNTYYGLCVTFQQYLGIDDFTDINTVIEQGGPNTSNKWKTNGTSYWLTHDGTHLHSYSAMLCSKVFTPGMYDKYY